MIIWWVVNFKITLRYSQNPIMGFNRIENTFFCLLIIRVIVNCCLVHLKDEDHVYEILFLLFFNIFTNWKCLGKIQYENPQIQYLCVLTQLYMWINLFIISFDSFFVIESYTLLALQIPVAVIYLGFGIRGSGLILSFMEKRYAQLFLADMLGKHKNQNFLQQANLKKIIIIISLLLETVLKPDNKHLNNSCDHGNLKWSKHMRTICLQYITICSAEAFQEDWYSNNNSKIQNNKIKRSRKSGRKSDRNPINFHGNQFNHISHNIYRNTSCSQEIFSNIVSNQSFQNYMQGKQCQFPQNNEKVIDLIWRIIANKYRLSKHSSRRLNYFVCYNLPVKSNVMKFRLFYCYFLVSRKKLGWLGRYQADLCHQLLTNLYNQKCFRFIKLQKENPIKPNIKESEIFRQNKCLKAQAIPTRVQLRKIIVESEMFDNIVQCFHEYWLNQTQYTNMFKNIQNNSIFLKDYYRNKNAIRKKLQKGLKDCRDYSLNLKCLMLQYLFLRFVQKIQNIGKIRYFQDLQELYRSKRKQSQTAFCKNTNIDYKSFFGPYCDDSENREISKMSCVISGVQNIGQIITCCEGFKQKLELKNELNQLSHTVKQDINNLIPIIWRTKHKQLMKSVVLYEKPFNHLQNRYFMVSKVTSVYFEVKFTISFLVNYLQDLYFFIDISYVPLEFISIKETKTNTICKSSGLTMTSCGNVCLMKSLAAIAVNNKNDQNNNQQQQYQQIQTQQRYQQYNIDSYDSFCCKIFNKKYEIITRLFLEQQPFSSYNCYASYSSQLKMDYQQTIRMIKQQQDLASVKEEQLANQIKFHKYKKSFAYLLRDFRIVVFMMFLVNLLFPILYGTYLGTNQSDIDVFMEDLKSTLGYANQFCMEQSYAGVSIGMFYNIARGAITFQTRDEMEKQFWNLLYSLVDLKKEAFQRYAEINYQKFESPINMKIFDHTWFQGLQNSLQFSFLKNDQSLLKAISIFTNPNFMTMDFLTKIQNEEAQIVLTYQNQTHTLKQSKAKSKSQSNLSSISFNLDLSSFELKMIQSFGFHIKQVQFLFFNRDGFINNSYDLLIQRFNEITQKKAWQHYLQQCIMLILVVLLYFLKCRLILNFHIQISYSLAISTNLREKLKKQQQTLFNLISDLSYFNSEKQFRKSMSSTSLTSPTTDSSQHMKTKFENFTMESKYNIFKPKSPEDNYSSSNFVRDSSMPYFGLFFAKALLIFFVISVIYQDQKEQYEKIIKHLNGMSDMMIYNGQLVQSFTTLLYPKIYKNHAELKQQFDLSAKYTRELEQRKAISNVFPFHPQVALEILYYDICQQIHSCPLFMRNSPGLLGLSSQTMFTLQNLMLDLSINKNFLSPGYLRNFHYINQLVFLIDDVSERSFKMINKYIQDTGLPPWYEIMVCLLLMDFVISLVIFYTNIRVFHEEQLNLACWSSLLKEKRFQYFVNKAIHVETISAGCTSFIRNQRDKI